MTSLSHTRRCTKCQIPITDRRSSSYCNSCYAAYRQERRKQGFYQDSPEKRRDQNYRSNYGITLRDYNRMLESQDGVCFICGRPETIYHHHGKLKPLGVDHNHATGQVRGLLCTACNTLVYTLESDPTRASKAIEYLQFFASQEQEERPLVVAGYISE